MKPAVLIGNETDVQVYSATLVKGENQLLVTFEGNLFITNGDGTYRETNGNDAKEHIEKINKTIQNLNKKIESLEQSEIHASNVKVDVEENGTIIKKSLQEVITNLLNGVIIPTEPTNAAYCGSVYCGMAECGDI